MVAHSRHGGPHRSAEIGEYPSSRPALAKLQTLLKNKERKKRTECIVQVVECVLMRP
jgi:hypothetical protein